MDFSVSKRAGQRLKHLVPGGGHTYAKGADQYPEQSPAVLARGQGCHVWDLDGNEFIEYGMGLRAVTLGHAYPPVVAAVKAALELGTNFTRPAAMELECAEKFLEIVKGAEMVKFTKDGSTADTAALRLARAYTGRDMVALCAEHPFFSYDDWFMCTTTMDGGIPDFERTPTVRFSYNDLESVETLFAQYPERIAAVFLEPARSEEPKDDFLHKLQALCKKHGAVLVFDEMITGFRWSLGGAQEVYGVVPDLSAFGKALANGFSVSALCGSRDIMRLGSRERPHVDLPDPAGDRAPLPPGPETIGRREPVHLAPRPRTLRHALGSTSEPPVRYFGSQRATFSGVPNAVPTRNDSPRRPDAVSGGQLLARR